MTRMELDDFCAEAGTDNGKGKDLWRDTNMALQIMRSVMQQSRSHSRTATSAAITASSASRNTQWTAAAAD